MNGSRGITAAAAGLGVLAAAAGIAASSAVAALLDAPSPIITVGNRVIEQTPPFLKDFAVEQFGENDKQVLLGGMYVTIALLAAVAGALGVRRPRLAVGLTSVLGIVALLTAALDDTTANGLLVRLVPALVALVVSVAAIVVLLSSLVGRTERAWLAPRTDDDVPGGFDRRRFLAAALGVGAVVVAGGIVTRVWGGLAATASRAGISIPTPDSAAKAVPAGVQPEVDGISPYLTPNRDFYRVDTALQVPDVPADTWKLRIHGMVDQELELSFADLLDERLIERRITLTCVSNQVGGPYVGNATWIGVPIADLLERAGVTDGADAIKSTSADGMTIGTPLGAVTDGRDAIVAVAMNGEPLPLEHGFPARMVVPGLYGYVSATKWLVDLEVTRFADFEAYWTPRGYAEEAPIKLSSRIDVPKSFQAFDKDAVRVGGVAWAQNTGIAKVEVKVDDGDWTDVDLAARDSVDTWRQWSWTWDQATEGTHNLTVRATDEDGTTQTSERAKIRPSGTTGWHSVQFSVR